MKKVRFLSGVLGAGIMSLVSANCAFGAGVGGSNDSQTPFHSAGNRPGGSDGPAASEDTPSDSGSFGEFMQEGMHGGIWQQDQLLGDAGGVRSFLSNYGISVNINETSEYFADIGGGAHRGGDYDGLTTITTQLDTNRAFGWYGGTFNASVLDVQGSNLSSHYTDNLQTVSGIEADNGLRLWELWYDQSFDFNQMDVKIGQQSLDQEFIYSQYAGLFVNTSFGWPVVPSVDEPSGGPAYPLSSLGVRYRYQPAGNFSFLGGVFDDNPSGISPTSTADSQRLNRYGTNFRLGDEPLVIGEIQFTRPGIGDLEYGDQKVLPGTFKLGGYYDFGKFANQEFGTDDVNLANGNGDPKQRRGNYSVYVVADQLLWRESPEEERGVGAFFRGLISPDDRNPVNYNFNAGLTLREPFEHREDDVLGIGMGYANVSPSDRALDSDSDSPVKRSGETFIEVTYQYAFAPWLTLQPDIQYTFNPGGGITNPDNVESTSRLHNETVVGIRTNISF